MGTREKKWEDSVKTVRDDRSGLWHAETVVNGTRMHTSMCTSEVSAVKQLVWALACDIEAGN
jgi:hypothetical protein